MIKFIVMIGIIALVVAFAQEKISFLVSIIGMGLIVAWYWVYIKDKSANK